MKTKLTLAAALLLALASCQPAPKKDGTSKQTDSNEQTLINKSETSSPNYIGTYQGTLPCADCDGIQTILSLHEDTTYDLATHYLSKGQTDTIHTCGVYHVLKNEVIEIVTPSSNEKTYYKILKDKNAVMLSDKEGTINQGELADLYLLKKKE